MSIIWYVIAWILILLIIVALSFVIIFGRKIDNCRTSKVLWCYADETTGWRCDGPDGPGTITLHDQLAFINEACNPIACPSLGDPVPTTAANAQFTVLPFDDAFICGTEAGFPCNPSTDLTSNNLINFPNDPLVPINNTITGEQLMEWFCNISEPLSTTKIAALNAFTQAHPEAYICQSVTFKGAVSN